MVVLENPFKYDPLSNEVLRVLAPKGSLVITASKSNVAIKNIEKTAADKGLVLVRKQEVKNNGSKQTNGSNIRSEVLIEYVFKKIGIKIVCCKN